jgi:hypothetical protein
VIGRQPTGGNHAMHVWVPDERLSPRVEDAQDADFRAQMAWVGRDLEEVAALA